jgi:hypothetical protein
MMKLSTMTLATVTLVPVSAVMLLACNTSEPKASTDPAISVGTSAEALRQLGQRVASDVEECRAIAASCASEADSGSNVRCDRLEQHCDQLAQQLAEDRAELEQCLEEAAACEQSAADPAECEAARAECTPSDRQFQSRRGRTLQCASRTEQCLDPGARFGRARAASNADAGAAADADADADAGAQSCNAEATDFVGCCRGQHAGAGDAGVGAANARRPGAFGGFPAGRGGAAFGGNAFGGNAFGANAFGQKNDAQPEPADAGAGPFRRRF